MKKIIYLFTFMLLFVACEQIIENEDINIPETNLAEEWEVSAYIDNSVIFGPFTISTQMTSENESIYIKDNGEFWNFQIVAETKDSKNEFEAISTVNKLSNVGAKIMIVDGKIINNESINFDIQFEDDEEPYAFTYKIMGHRK